MIVVVISSYKYFPTLFLSDNCDCSYLNLNLTTTANVQIYTVKNEYIDSVGCINKQISISRTQSKFHIIY